MWLCFLYNSPAQFPHTVFAKEREMLQKKKEKGLTAQFLFAASRWRPPACTYRPVLELLEPQLITAQCNTCGEPSWYCPSHFNAFSGFFSFLTAIAVWKYNVMVTLWASTVTNSNSRWETDWIIERKHLQTDLERRRASKIRDYCCENNPVWLCTNLPVTHT